MKKIIFSIFSSGKIYIHALFSIISFATIIVGGIIVVPITLSKLGKTDYGLWIFVNTFASYSSIFFLGFGVAIITYVAQYAVEKKRDHLEKALGTMFLTYLAVGSGVFVIGCLIATFLPFLIAIPNQSYQYQIATVILSFQIAISFPLSIYQAILTGLEKYVIRDTIVTCCCLLNYLGVILVPLEFANVLFFASLSFLTNLLMGISNYICYRYFLSEVKIYRKNYCAQIFPSLFKISIHSFVINTARKIINITDMVIIGIVLGPIAVTLYSVPQKLMTYLQQLLWKAQSVVFPKFIKLNFQKNNENTASFYLLSFRYSLVLCAPISIIFFIYGGIFQVMWMGKDFVFVHDILIVLMISAFFTQPLINTFLNSSEQRKVAAKINSIQAVSNLILSIVFIQYYGILGVAIATSVSNFFIGFLWLNKEALRSIEISFQKFCLESLWPILIPYIICFFCIRYLFFLNFGLSVFSFLVVCTLAECIFLFVYIFFDSRIKKRILNVFK